MELEPVDGGPNYYAQFTAPLSSSPDYFPLSVWGSYNHFQSNIDKDKAVGINVYTWVADPDRLANIRNNGLRVIGDDNPGYGAETAGWLLGDEPDMQGQSCPAWIDQQKALRPNDGRLHYANYGKGVMFWDSDATASCWVNGQALVSDDIYWFTDPYVCTSLSEGPHFFGLNRPLTQAECRRASNYGAIMGRMRMLDNMDGQRKPIWNFVEVGCPFSNGGCITPAQTRGAVWHSLIAGARGILYFQHSFGGPSSCREHHVLRNETGCYAAMVSMVTSVNAQIKALAPALNGPSLSSGFTANANVRARAKWDGTNFYVFAASAENGGPFTGSFSIPCVGNATASVMGENRSVSVTEGAWSDSFANGDAVHIYRIDGGSTCGLT